MRFELGRSTIRTEWWISANGTDRDQHLTVEALDGIAQLEIASEFSSGTLETMVGNSELHLHSAAGEASVVRFDERGGEYDVSTFLVKHKEGTLAVTDGERDLLQYLNGPRGELRVLKDLQVGYHAHNRLTVNASTDGSVVHALAEGSVEMNLEVEGTTGGLGEDPSVVLRVRDGRRPLVVLEAG